MTRECMINGFWAINRLNAWGWLKSFVVDPKRGFMFSSEPMITSIGNMMESTEAPVTISHSGASFGLTMRNLKYIADNGMDAFKELVESKKNNQMNNYLN